MNAVEKMVKIAEEFIYMVAYFLVKAWKNRCLLVAMAVPFLMLLGFFYLA